MNCLISIRQRYAGFAQSDKKLADFLLAQPDRARHLSSQQLALEAGVSQSSVVKFAQKLGFKGFPALKLAISEALASSPDPCPSLCTTRSSVTIRCAWWAKS
jgi:DNA-binding MurR/RpiR family transcriptional regulator